MSIKHIGNAIFVDTEKVQGTKNIYTYVNFKSLERAEYGLFCRGKAWDDWTDSIKVGTDMYDPATIAAYWQFLDAVKEVGKRRKHVFEEVSAVDATEVNKDEWTESGLDPDDWDGPGVYDFRDMSFNRRIRSGKHDFLGRPNT